MSADARDFYRNGPSFFAQHFPYWMSWYGQRGLALLLALLTIAIPISNYGPRIIRWHFRNRLVGFYRRLRAIEDQLHGVPDRDVLNGLAVDLEELDRTTRTLSLPIRPSDLLFSLKVHINLVRTRLAALRSALPS